MMFGVTEKLRRFRMRGNADGARERHVGKPSPALEGRGSRDGGKFAAEALEGRLLFASTPTPPNIPGNWALAFNDNFTSINPAVWSNTYWWGGTQGTQATFSPSALSVNSNGLNITATQVASKSSTGVTNPYTSGAIQTAGLPYQGKSPGFTFTYGYVETTMKAASGLGMWSAIWMLPADHNDNYELDLAEILGRQPKYYTATYHTGSTFWQPNGTVSSDLTAGFHTYGVDWEPDHITWYIDGVALGSYTNAAQIINRPMYLILNLDVGGPWAGPLGSTSPYSGTWQTQDVRVWQHTTATPPAAPTNLHSTSTTSTSVALSWTASTSTGISGYNVFRNGTQIGSVAATVTSLLDSNDSPSTSYTYTVDAFNTSGGVSALSSPLVVTTLAGSAPAAPTSLHSTSTTSTSVALSWTASTSTGVTGYNVFRNGTKIGSPAGTSLTDSGLTPSTSYTYTVDAFNASGGVSALSASLVVSTLASSGTAPLPPTNLFSSCTTTTQVAVSWIASTSANITSYNVFKNGTKIGTVAGNYTFLVDYADSPGTTYTYTADAVNSAGLVSTMSAPFVVTTLGGVAPAAPTGLSSTSTTTTSVALAWIASTSTGVTGYNVFRNGTKIGSVAGTVTSLVDSGLSAGTTYTYTVSAFNAAGSVSALSAAFVVTTATSSLTKVNLSGAFNEAGIVNDGTTFAQTSGLAGSGDALSANVLGTSQTWNGNAYTIGAAGGNNAITAKGQTITLPQGKYASLSFLGMALNGNQANQSFVVHYTNGTTQTFTQSMSDWFTPQSYAGESNAISVPYIDWASNYRDNRTFHVYGYRFALNAAKTVASITLPNNGNVQILAMDLSNP